MAAAVLLLLLQCSYTFLPSFPLSWDLFSSSRFTFWKVHHYCYYDIDYSFPHHIVCLKLRVGGGRKYPLCNLQTHTLRVSASLSRFLLCSSSSCGSKIESLELRMNVVVVNGIPWGIWKARQQLGFPFAFNGYSHVCLAGYFCVFSPYLSLALFLHSKDWNLMRLDRPWDLCINSPIL